jgi:hypothetical protein
MSKPNDWCETFGEVESLIRASADFVQPSRDLRPRVLEAGRLENGERRARRRIGRAGSFAAMLAFFTVSAVEWIDTSDTFRHLTLVASASHAASMRDGSGGDSGWALVEAYTELRRRQAEVLRL